MHFMDWEVRDIRAFELRTFASLVFVSKLLNEITIKMSSGFSSILKLSDLDDFITPSQECIKPVHKPLESESSNQRLSKVKIELEDDGTYTQIRDGEALPLEKVSITLSDCLACSGCVTSAESILISQQGPEELVRILAANENAKRSLVGEDPRLCVITLGVQAVLSIAHKFNLAPQEAAERLAGMFIELGADKVTTATIGEDLSLIESAKEFIGKYEEVKNGAKFGLPILTGICPGWVCYSEKLHSHSIPSISGVKSPQQIMGSLIKLIYGPSQNFSPDSICHITLMPCFDRKLEASREDFYLKEYRTKEVDSVITPVEVEQILENLGKSLTDFQPMKLENLFDIIGGNLTIGYSLMSHNGSGSGGYAEYVLKSAAKTLFGRDLEHVNWTPGRNPDISESNICDSNGDPILKFCIATGFRNIQTIVRKLKSKALTSSLPHYIEIMACPTGCMNGGAQSRTTSETAASREVSFLLESNYHALPLEKEESAVNHIYERLGNSDSELYRAALYTQFHAIEKLPGLGMGIKW